jgi:peptide/nickel transport system permease protein
MRRLGIFLLSLLVASILVFVVLSVLPGDPAQAILGTQATPEALARLRTELGLDAPAWLRYLRWVAGLLHGDLGRSPVSGISINSEIGGRVVVSVPLALLAMCFALLIAVPLGMLAAIHHQKITDTLISAASQLGFSLPAFWAGILLITLFAVKLRWLPAGGFVRWEENPLGAFRSLLLPAFALAVVQGAILTRYVRSAVLDVMGEDYIRTAMAKGLTRTQALVRHGLRNAAIPVVTVLGLQLTFLLAGAIVIENVFYLPGLGRMLFQAIGNRDLTLVQSTVMVITSAVLLVNFVVEVSYGWIDPRVKVGL